MTKNLLEHDPKELWAQWNADPKKLLRKERLQEGFDFATTHITSPTTAATFIRLTVEALGKGDDTEGAQKLGWSSAGVLYSALYLSLIHI